MSNGSYHKANLIPKLLLLTVSALFAFLLCDLVLSPLLHLPRSQIKDTVHYLSRTEKDFYWSILFEAGAEYRVLEGGNHRYQRNNLGLPGIDTDLNKKHKVAVLGASFVEALQVPPEHIAASVLQQQLEKTNDDFAVLNLGQSGYNPYDSWRLLEYYKREIPIDYVILIISSDNTLWFHRNPRPLQFYTDGDFGRSKHSQMGTYLRNKVFSSPLLYFYYYSLGNSIKQMHNGNQPTGLRLNFANMQPPCGQDPALPPVMTDAMQETVVAFRKNNPHFLLYSIVDDDKFNSSLSHLCNQYGIPFAHFPFLRAQYRINGIGHLSEEGNRLLGIKLYDMLMSYFHQKQPTSTTQLQVN